MNSPKIRMGVTTVLLGLLTSGAFALTTTTATAAPLNAPIVSSAHFVQPNICRFGCD